MEVEKIAEGCECWNPNSSGLEELVSVSNNDQPSSSLMEELEAMAKRRLADEYDAAQERGEIRNANTGRSASALEAPTVSDIGLTHKDIHEARQIRDAEADDPGVVRRTLDALLEAGEEPTKAAVIGYSKS